MYSRTLLLAAVVGAALLTGCGTSTTGPNGGSKAETMTGAPPSGFPGAGQPKDAESPALSSSSEQRNSNPTPKVPVEGPVKAAPSNNP